MEKREIRSLHDLKVERDFVKQEIKLKFSETHQEWNKIIFNLKHILVVGAVTKVMTLFKKKPASSET